MQFFEAHAVVVPRVSPVSCPEQEARLPSTESEWMQGWQLYSCARGPFQTSQPTELIARSVAVISALFTVISANVILQN